MHFQYIEDAIECMKDNNLVPCDPFICRFTYRFAGHSNGINARGYPLKNDAFWRANYWAQNTAHSGELEMTDSTHSLLCVLQLFFLLFYTYAAALGMQFEGDDTALALQSLTLLIAGILGFAAWAYAIRDGRLLADYAKEDQVAALLVRSLAEPITALITLPLAFVSGTAWELAWLLYIPLAWYLGRKDRMLRAKFRIGKAGAGAD